VHAITLGALHRPAHPAHAHVRQHQLPVDHSLSPEIRTVGDMLRQAGYYTAYKGKWHLTKDFETVNTLGTPTKIFTQEMEAYGFSDYFGIGDIIAHTRAATCTMASLPPWPGVGCAAKVASCSPAGKPWSAVNLVNPHDVMFYDTGRARNRGFRRSAASPMWPVTPSIPSTPSSGSSSFHRPTSSLWRRRPTLAHRDFLRAHDALVGCHSERNRKVAPAAPITT